MQKMMSEFPNKLVNDSRQVLSLVDQVLSDFIVAKEDNEDMVGVALSLLNIVLISPSFRTSYDADSRLDSIRQSLQIISGRLQSDVSSTASNLLLVLRFGLNMEEQEAMPASTATDRQIEDRKTFGLAMSYLTATDSPPPVDLETDGV